MVSAGFVEGPRGYVIARVWGNHATPAVRRLHGQSPTDSLFFTIWSAVLFFCVYFWATELRPIGTLHPFIYLDSVPPFLPSYMYIFLFFFFFFTTYNMELHTNKYYKVCIVPTD